MKYLIFPLIILLFSSCDADGSGERLRKVVPTAHITWEDGWAREMLQRHQDSFPQAVNMSGMVFDPLGVQDTGCSGACDPQMLAWLRSMALKRLDAVYMDRAERILYNRYAASEDALPDPRGLLAFEQGDTVWINVFLPATLNGVGPGDGWAIRIGGDYPLSGDIHLGLEGAAEKAWTLAFRQPGWTDNRPDPMVSYRWRSNRKLVVDLGGEYLYPELRDGYAYLTRTWQTGDDIHLSFPMSVRRLMMDDMRMSLEHGPVVLAAKQHPEEQDALPDQGPFMFRAGNQALDRWLLARGRDTLQFFRWCEMATQDQGRVIWNIQY